MVSDSLANSYSVYWLCDSYCCITKNRQGAVSLSLFLYIYIYIYTHTHTITLCFICYSFEKSVLEEVVHQSGDDNLGEHQHFWFNELHTSTYFCMELLMPLSTHTVLIWYCIVSDQTQNKKDF